jgi:hypothetical protein
MARQVAPTDLTGGGGFGFEDQIAAVALLDMVSGQHFLDPPLGFVTQVHWQGRDLGWLLDDLVLEFKDGTGGQHFAAISIKSDRQVTSSGFPANFVHDAWELWLKPGAPFVRDRDILVLAVGELANDVASAWNTLLREALATSPDRLVKRLTAKGMTSRLAQTLFRSLRCPKDLDPRRTISDEVVCSFLRCVRLLHFDFHCNPSGDLAKALLQATGAVASNRSNDGHGLLKALTIFSANQRPSGGTASLETVLNLPGLPALQVHPDYHNDWAQINRVTEDSVGRISDTIGGKCSLLRKSIRDSVVKGLAAGRLCVLLSPSGMGKSVLAKQSLQAMAADQRVWLDHLVWAQTSLEGVRRNLGVEHSLASLFSVSPAQSGLVVFDGMDRLGQEGLGLAAQALSAACSNPRWKAIVTCTLAAWDNVAHSLAQAAVEVPPNAVVQVPPLGKDDLSAVCAAIPSIAPCVLRPELRPFIETPKILDWLADGLVGHATASTQVVSMPDLVECLWARWIRTGEDRYKRSEALKKIASIEGDILSSEVAIGSLAGSEDVLARLESDQVISVRSEHVRFRHDLLGDWARLYVLIENRGNASAWVADKHRLPQWHNSIQLFGQWLLCQKDGVAAWKALATQTEGPDQLGAGQDLLLDSIILSTDAASAFRQLWDALVEQDGRLLRRLLRRFLHVATMPDPRVEVAFENSERVGARARCRLPFWPLWLPMLKILAERGQEVTKCASDLTAEIAQQWLTWTSSSKEQRRGYPGRRDAAQLAILAAKEFQGLLAEDEIGWDDRKDDTAWTALFAAADVLPEEVGVLALEMAGRRAVRPGIAARAEDAQWRRKDEMAKRLAAETKEQREVRKKRLEGVSLGSMFPEGKMLPPWPDGPIRQIEESFRKACLSSDAILPLFHQRPDVGREVLLAACIEAPHREDPFGAADFWGDSHGTWRDYDLEPPMFFWGPFYGLLKAQPQIGIEVILRLVHFTTDRWEEWDERCAKRVGEIPENMPRSVKVLVDDAEVECKGNDRVFGWYRNYFGDASITVCALMALEKWLYDQLETQEGADQWLEHIVRNTRSVAIVGVLCAVARKRPALLVGSLRPLMSIWQAYEWERRLLLEESSIPAWRFDLMNWSRFGERIFNIAKDWHALPHRKSDFQIECIKHLLSNREVQYWFNTVRGKWQGQLAQNPGLGDLERLIARLDPRNYRLRQDGEMLRVELQYPAALDGKINAAASEADLAMKVMSFPIKCRRILDGELVLSDQEVEPFWNEMRDLASMADASRETQEVFRGADVVCGGIAVLLRFHRRWIIDDQARLDWCVRHLEQVVNAPPRRPFDVPSAAGSHSWDCFWAEAAIILLAEFPDGEGSRCWAADAVMQFHHNATACALQAVWREREKLGDDVVRLVNLAVSWAGVRHTVEWARQLDVGRDLYLRWADRAWMGFVERKLPAERLVDCSRLNSFFARIAERLQKRAWQRRNSDGAKTITLEADSALAHLAIARHQSSVKWLGLDTGVLSACMSLLAEISSDPRFRKMQIGILRHVLGMVLWALEGDTRKEDEEAGEIRGTPHEFDLKVFGCIARFVPQLHPDDHPEEFYQPIIDLGPAGHYWVEAFLVRWFADGITDGACREVFFAEWRRMIEYAEKHPLWQLGNDGRASFRLCRLWANMMGLELAGHALRDGQDNAKFIEQMKPSYQRWAENWLADEYIIRDFAHFCTTPAGRVLLLEGLAWVAEVIGLVVESRDFSKAGSAIAGMCGACWEWHRAELTRNKELRDAFLEILAVLADQQQPEGLQLRDEVLRSLTH